ncbi:helix-turn-helix domain-containing protein [Jeotgalibaca sp. MA1X17-3]|uniref:helix-turn-helix domain-containing protein n=1 Tax=Jeotgalibaca sp. MA1X17-3 TaxID=2908211 RepID=UPI001F29277F|nr:helix-turn-helix domain-containing protein [Jeotgalibaca sp. MA1X17-3]UJF16071.1 helix-turn-helix domain-containing protein [Jeotgalibaca sp. MA1X17-3]
MNVIETAEYIDVPVSEIERLIREGQIRTIKYEEEILINRNQFKLFIKERKKYEQELRDYLEEPIPEDIDVKDED